MSDPDASSSAGAFHAKMSFSSGNVSEQWRVFKRQLSYFFDSKYTQKQLTDRKMIGVLMTALGREGIELYETFFDSDVKPKYVDVIEAFDNFCYPRKNTVFERSVYFRLRQKQDQSVDMYILELKKQASLCEFSDDERENLIRDILVIGIKDPKLREELLRDPELNLITAVNACKARERSQVEASQMESLQTPDRLTVASIDKRSSPSPTRCSACSYTHGAFRPCPALKGKCHKCGQVGHFSRACRSRGAPKAVKAVETTAEPEPVVETAHADLLRIYGFHTMTVHAVQEDDSGETAWYVNLPLGKKSCKFKIDTAAACDTMSMESYNLLEPKPKLLPPSVIIKPYNAPPFRPLGTVVIPYAGADLRLQIMPAGEENLLGFKTCKRLHLIERVSHISAFSSRDSFVATNCDLFKGEGKIPGLNKLYIDPTVCPKAVRPRRFAYSLVDKLIATLKLLQEQDVIAPVTEPTPWVSNLTLVEKSDGTLRVCLDPQNLNKALQIPKYAIPKADDILVKLANMRFFTVLDLKSGFWHMQLDDESSLLTTFNSPIGRFRFRRLCFGISCAPEVFMAEMVRIFGDIEGVSPYFDDIIIAAETEEKHDAALQRVCQRAREFNIKFNTTKLQFKQPSVQYLGLFISERGLQPAAKHIRAIREMPTPCDKPAVLRFLGLVKFLARFLPNVSNLTSSLRALTHKDADFCWQAEHESEFQKLKNLIVAKPVLAFFDINKPIMIQTDSSKDGLGSVLIQENRPVAFASRALTAAERKYSQIEKELLAIVFAVERFHEFVYGRPVLVQSDHRPLEAILRKDLDKVTARLQRLRLRLLKYNVNVTYTPGKDLLVADALSRAFLPDETPNLEYQTVTVHAATSLAVSPQKVEWIAAATSSDPVLSVVKEWILTGAWPDSGRALAPGLSKFYALRHDLAEVDGMIFFENRLVVPVALRTFFLTKLHEGHLGVEKTKRAARDAVFWHGLSVDVTNFVLTCETCQRFAKNNAKQPLNSYPIPTYPWQHIAVDIATCERRDYLIVVDKYSNWPEVISLSSKSAPEIVLHLQNVFARHGIPEVVVSDNNPFNSSAFASFADEWGFTPVYTSPHFPQSNGHAEKTVQTVKAILHKCHADGTSLQYALLQYRNTPVADTGCSPAQALVGRRLRTKLPVSSALLRPRVISPERIVDSKERSQDVQQYYYNRAAEDLPSLQPAQPVWVKDTLADPQWQPATIRSEGPTPRSFIVEKEDSGGTVVRNRRFLRPRNTIRKPSRFET